ncbi:cell division protein FtsZ [Pelagerythrobacter rhizovicinus]|uniref:Cell division protein FtsZ n=1 Tax=Pelagerythrobacter rhizovicinus TaxID=2268576 RepID=A0A4Q2KI82_9SPHN|nr:cell division protein FtsZ [Pelagerythrobacter rhizovicinus]RXZ64029.1 cell division protein FtsZ [Pelagerythrobacter rhizovicinus]
MSINIGPAASEDLRPRIAVIGVGGAGGNAISNMMAAQIEGVEFIVANTDAQVLSNSPAPTRIQLGPDITGGLGAGARPEVGKAAAEETVSEIEDALDGANMCFIAAGMGGGTGTGAAPVIAEVARRKGVLTVGVVTKPFLFEGTRRMRAAEAGILELQKHVDTLIVIPNQNLFLIAKAETTFKEAFQLADEVLQQGVRSITDLMVMPGLINLDFADIESVMQEAGKAMMGTGEGEGENRALEAAERAIANPLLEGVSMQGAKGVIISIIGGEDMKLLEVDEAANHIRELVDEDANIIWGSAFNADLEGKIRVSVVATGIDVNAEAGSDNRPVPLASSRAPKRPVLELPSESEYEEEKPAPAPATEPAREPASFARPADREEEDQEDVDGIVDPLAGLRNEIAESRGGQSSGEGIAEPADDSDHAVVSEGRGFSDDRSAEDGRRSQKEPLDLTSEVSAETGREPTRQDELLLDADRLAEEDRPVQPRVGGPDAGIGRRRGLVSGEGGGASGGSTLFERMANLSRGSADRDAKREGRDDQVDDEEDAGALNIPRFLGRQNNQ